MAKQKEKKWYQKTGDWLEKYVEPVVEYGKYLPIPIWQQAATAADIAFDIEDVYSEARKGNYKGAAGEAFGLLGNPLAAKGVSNLLGKHAPDALTKLAASPDTFKGVLARGGGELLSDFASGKSAREFQSGGAASPAADAGAFDDYANAYLTDTMQGARAVGQQMGQSLNRRGLGGSGLAAGLQSQAMTQAMGRANSELAKMRIQYQQGQQQLLSQEQMQSDQMFYNMMSQFAIFAARIGADRLGGDDVNLDYTSPAQGAANWEFDLGFDYGPEANVLDPEMLKW